MKSHAYWTYDKLRYDKYLQIIPLLPGIEPASSYIPPSDANHLATPSPTGNKAIVIF